MYVFHRNPSAAVSQAWISPNLDLCLLLIRRQEKALLDLEESITILSNNQGPRLEVSLREAIGNLFSGKQSMGESPVNKGIVPKALQKATHEDFQAVMLRICLENK